MGVFTLTDPPRPVHPPGRVSPRRAGLGSSGFPSRRRLSSRSGLALPSPGTRTTQGPSSGRARGSSGWRPSGSTGPGREKNVRSGHTGDYCARGRTCGPSSWRPSGSVGPGRGCPSGHTGDYCRISVPNSVTYSTHCVRILTHAQVIPWQTSTHDVLSFQL